MMFASVFALSYLKLKGLTDNGQYLAGQVLGLKHYMEDFSEFKDRGVADMTLWGRYMVYATAFGISEKAMKQMLKAYPQLADPNWLDANASDSLLYWSYRSWYFNHRYAGPASVETNSMDFSQFSANFGDIGAPVGIRFRGYSIDDFGGVSVRKFQWFRRQFLRWRFRRFVRRFRCR